MSVIKVQFDRSKNDCGFGNVSKEYAYICDYAVAVGDRVIVDAPTTGYTTVTVSDVSAGLDAIRATKEVVCVVDDGRYKARKAAKARLAEIEAELKYRADVVNINKTLKKALKKDKVAKELFKEADNVRHILNDDPESYHGGIVDSMLRQGYDVEGLGLLHEVHVVGLSGDSND